jgi:hypothetical protein
VWALHFGKRLQNRKPALFFRLRLHVLHESTPTIEGDLPRML